MNMSSAFGLDMSEDTETVYVTDRPISTSANFLMGEGSSGSFVSGGVTVNGSYSTRVNTRGLGTLTVNSTLPTTVNNLGRTSYGVLAL